MRASHGITAVFDEPNLVSAGGLVPALRLAENAGLSRLLAALVTLPVAGIAAKVRTVIAGMLAGADSIDDLDVLRAGGTAKAVAGVRAPSTIGTFLRSFTHGHVLQLRAAARSLLVGLKAQVPALVGSDDLVFVDLDDTIREVHGYAKQGTGFGYTKVRGLNALLAVVSTPSSAPVIAETSLRKGATKSGKHAEWHFARAMKTIKKLIGPSQRVWLRADSAFCNYKNIAAALKAKAWFSITIPAWPTVTAAVSQIPEAAWTAIKYTNAIWDAQAGAWISEAEVAECDFVAFTSRKKTEHVHCRLVVRRVKRLNTAASAGQGELFDTWRYHAFITNTDLVAVDADAWHRKHAIVEQVIAELKDGPLAHLPSGRFAANDAWLTLAAMAFNIARAAAHAAGTPRSRMATVRRALINVPVRIAHRARRHVMHLPEHWPWARAWTNLWDTICGPPPRGDVLTITLATSTTRGRQWKSRADRQLLRALTTTNPKTTLETPHESTTVDQG